MEREWTALAHAEEIIYAGDRGAHPLTSVMQDSSDVPWLADLWEWSEGYIFDTTDPDVNVTTETARRVAASIKMLTFGY